jgi:ATP phosphoribosyltransferase
MSLWSEVISLWCEVISLWCEVISLWREVISLWCEVISLWREVISLWREVISLWREIISLWREIVSLWREIISLWREIVSLWREIVSYGSGHFILQLTLPFCSLCLTLEHFENVRTDFGVDKCRRMRYYQYMKNYLINTPEGTRDRLWEESAARRKLERALAELFELGGYKEVRTPVLEFYELYQIARNPIPADNMVKLTGRGGKLLVLRPDNSTPIARIAATRIEDFPCRLYYAQSVYRLAGKGRGDSCELGQCGVELFGVAGCEGDAEIITLAVLALRAAGVRDFHIELGGLATAELSAIVALLNADIAEQVRFEPLLTQEIDYYTGMVFRAYASGAGKAVLAGGRYDKLVGDFGRDMPAVGFAMYVDEVLAIREHQDGSGSELRIAVTKGRMLDDTLTLLGRAGFELPDSVADKDDRRLIHRIPNSGISLVLAKAEDVITYCELGACQLGIVGRDTLLERGGSVTELLDLGCSACKFAVAAPVGTEIKDIRVVASKYPNVARNFFMERGSDVDVIKIDGSVELAPILGVADAIVDIVQTGATLQANGLQVIAEVSKVSARLIANPAATRLHKDAIEKLLQSIDGI